MKYLICGVNIEICSDREIQSGDYEKLFLTDSEKTDLLIDCSACTTPLPTAEAKCILQNSDEMAYRSRDEIYRGSRASRNSPLITLLQYSLNQPNHACLWIRETDCSWAANPPWLWHNIALPQLLPYFGALVLHGSFIEVDGKAIIFTAPSGTGKSTQAALWEKYRGAMVCNGDKTGLRIVDNTVFACGLPFCGTSDICRNITLPVVAVVSLSQASANTIKRLNLTAAIQSVMQNVYADKCVPEEWQHVVNLTIDVVSHVPVFDLACTPDEQAVKTLETALGIYI